MPTPLNDDKKTVMEVMNFRHSHDVKKFIEDHAEEHGIAPATLCRQVFNAGFEKVFKRKIRKNKIVSPPR